MQREASRHEGCIVRQLEDTGRKPYGNFFANHGQHPRMVPCDSKNAFDCPPFLFSREAVLPTLLAAYEPAPAGPGHLKRVPRLSRSRARERECAESERIQAHRQGITMPVQSLIDRSCHERGDRLDE